MTIVVIAYGQRTQTALETGLLEEWAIRSATSTAFPLRPANSWPTPTRSWLPSSRSTTRCWPRCPPARSSRGSAPDWTASTWTRPPGVASWSPTSPTTRSTKYRRMRSRCCWPGPDGSRSTWTWSATGQWNSTGAGTIRRLRGQTLGLAGFGRIGQAAAAKALGLGLRVLACDPYRTRGGHRGGGLRAGGLGDGAGRVRRTFPARSADAGLRAPDQRRRPPRDETIGRAH